MGTWTDTLDELRRSSYRAERDALGRALAQRVRDGAMPPDDAYAWTRVVYALHRKANPVSPESPPC